MSDKFEDAPSLTRRDFVVTAAEKLRRGARLQRPTLRGYAGTA